MLLEGFVQAVWRLCFGTQVALLCLSRWRSAGSKVCLVNVSSHQTGFPNCRRGGLLVTG